MDSVTQPEQPRSWLRRHRQILIFGAIFVLAAGIAAGVLIAREIAENRRLDATSVTLKPTENLTVPFGAKVKVSDFLEHLEGNIVDDFEIPTDELGFKTINFEYINIKNRRRPSSFTITVADTTPPQIFGKSAYTVARGHTGNLIDLMISGDDLDDHPTREIIGDYNLNQIGQYPLEYRITDASGNRTSHQFTLNVVAPIDANSTPAPRPSTPLSEFITQHKNAQTKVGIDVSSWQGNIDWLAVKAAGVEFAFLRVGYGYQEQCFLDKTFLANIAGATAAGLPVGVYFYSYADDPAESKAQAEWVRAQIGDYPVELGVVFDWEDWGEFNNYGISFRTLNQIAQSFLDTAASYGYKTSLYGSKYYLERFWQPTTPVWLAQYYHQATYTGAYWLWQLSDSGRVAGISGNVDIDIMYLSESVLK